MNFVGFWAHQQDCTSGQRSCAKSLSAGCPQRESDHESGSKCSTLPAACQRQAVPQWLIHPSRAKQVERLAQQAVPKRLIHPSPVRPVPMLAQQVHGALPTKVPDGRPGYSLFDMDQVQSTCIVSVNMHTTT